MVILSVISVAGGYFTLKPRALADQQRVRSSGDFAVSVDRSGTSSHALSQTPLGADRER